MKLKNLLFCTLFFCCTVGIHTLNAQLVEKASITADEANFKMISPDSYLMEIAGPNNYYFKQEIADTENISLSNVDMEGKKFPDGTYKLQVTPIVTLSETIRLELAALMEENDPEKIAAYRLAHELPAAVNVYNIAFSIRNGQFVSPDQKEVKGVNLPKMSSVWQQDHPALYASLNTVDMEYGKPVVTSDGLSYATDNTSMDEDAQVFVTDVIVQGSICVGFDCTSSESFGFDTERLKENNLRIHFQDTSSSASFPTTDWRIRINDSSNGGASYFAVEDATAGKTPFLIEANAPTNALYVEDSGDVGIGTNNPVVDIHNVTGNTPTLRLEQDGSSGFTPQTWDLASNETNFFIRDASNGSTLPFRIRPGAPTSSIDIEGTTGHVGLGTSSPEALLHLREGGSGDNGLPRIRFENTEASESWNMDVADNDVFRISLQGSGGTEFEIDPGGNVKIQFGNGLGATADLTVSGNFISGVTTLNVPDYVFKSDYSLMSLPELSDFIAKEGHLPNVPSAAEIAKEGSLNMSEFQMVLLEKIEELTIYTLQQQKIIGDLQAKLVDIQTDLDRSKAK